MPTFGQNPAGSLPSGTLGGGSNVFVTGTAVKVTDGTNDRGILGKIA